MTDIEYVNHSAFVNSTVYVSQLTCSLFSLQQKQLLCDVTLTADDGKLLAHSAVLAAASDFICSQFEQLTNRSDYSVQLPGCDLATLEVAIRLMYTGVVHVEDRAELDRVMNVCTTLGVNLHKLHNVSITVDAQSSSSTPPVYVSSNSHKMMPLSLCLH